MNKSEFNYGLRQRRKNKKVLKEEINILELIKQYINFKIDFDEFIEKTNIRQKINGGIIEENILPNCFYYFRIEVDFSIDFKKNGQMHGILFSNPDKDNNNNLFGEYIIKCSNSTLVDAVEEYKKIIENRIGDKLKFFAVRSNGFAMRASSRKLRLQNKSKYHINCNAKHC